MKRIVYIACIALVGLVTRLPVHAASDPLLQLSTGGASATTRTLLLNNDESLLISGGDDKVIRIWRVLPCNRVLVRGPDLINYK